MESSEGLFIQMLHQGWEDLKTRATYIWLFHRSWLPQSMAAPGLVRFPTRLQARVFQWTKQKFIGFYEFIVSHLLHFVVYKQVIRLPRFKGRRIWLHHLMREWQGSKGMAGLLQPSLKSTICHNQQKILGGRSPYSLTLFRIAWQL